MTIVAVGGVFGAATLLWILWPLVRRGGAAAAPPTRGVHDDLAERTMLLYQELEEIDLERERGDLSAAEHAALREGQKQRVLAILSQRRRQGGALDEAAARGDTETLSDAIEEEVLRIRARRRGQAPAAGSSEAVAQPPDRGIHWLWLGVPAVLVLLAFGAIFQLYRASARTLTEQTPIAQVNAASLVGFAHVAPGHVLLATSSGLQASRDGGRTWRAVEQAAAPAAVAVSPAGDGHAYVFTADALLATADAGQSWQDVPTELPGVEVLGAAVDPFAPTTLYASFRDTGLYRSQDGGKTWTPVATPQDDPIEAVFVAGLPPLLFIATASGAVQVSADDGRTWSAASGAVTMALRAPARALSGAPDASIMFAAAHTGLFMSTTAGQTWVDLPLRKRLVAVSVDPADARTVLAVTETGEVYRSADGGIAWRDE